MKRYTGFIAFMVLSLLVLMGCEQSEGEEDVDFGNDLYTQDINDAPQFITLDDASFHQSTYDLSFELGNMAYLVRLNSAAGVLALSTDTLDFYTETLPVVGFAPDSTAMVIGSSWMDVSTYNATDHSISANAMIYFIRSSDYHWVKFRVLSASPDTFHVEYAFHTDGSGWGSSLTEAVAYSSESPAHFSLSGAATIEPTYWDLCIASTPEYSTELQTNFFMPTFYVNFQAEVQIAYQDDLIYEEILSTPEGLEWMTDSSSEHPFGNKGTHQVLVYHPEPPYNHQVIVENPERIYFIKTVDNDYKLQFKEYSSGIVVFATEVL